MERSLSYADVERGKPTEVSRIFIAQGMLHQRLMPILSGEESRDGTVPVSQNSLKVRDKLFLRRIGLGCHRSTIAATGDERDLIRRGARFIYENVVVLHSDAFFSFFNSGDASSSKLLPWPLEQHKYVAGLRAARNNRYRLPTLSAQVIQLHLDFVHLDGLHRLCHADGLDFVEPFFIARFR